jgi:spermidine synthase
MPDHSTGDLGESDPFSPIAYTYHDATLLHEERSTHQLIQIHEHAFFGRMLVLDGVVQLTQRDEFYYHEMLVQPVMHAHPAPRTVLVVGGGDGGSMREVLRHASVEQAVLVDIDGRVTDVVGQWLPEMTASLADPRVERVAMPGAAFLAQDSRAFDVIIVDSTDPVGPATELFAEDFYRLAAERLTPDGILATQSESLHFHADFVTSVQQRLAAHFAIVDCVTQAIATYAGNWWTFSVGSKTIDVRVAARAPVDGVRYYAADVHATAFLPRSVLARVQAGRFPG